MQYSSIPIMNQPAISTIPQTIQIPPTVYVKISNNINRNSLSVAGFDLDHTLIRPIKSIHTANEYDFTLLPNRVDKLKEMINLGYVIVIVTNQSRDPEMKKRKIDHVFDLFESLNIPTLILASLTNDYYRKPNPGCWHLAKAILNSQIQEQYSFFVGDAGGRSSDFSDSDLQFANNAGIKFYHTEDFFAHVQIDLSKFQFGVITMVGMPGSGKTTLAHQLKQQMENQNLQQNVNFSTEQIQNLQQSLSRRIEILDSDIIKDKNKRLKLANQYLSQGISVINSATNPTKEGRFEWYSLAVKYRTQYLTIWNIRDGTGYNKLRPKPVPEIAIRTYFSRLEPPGADETTIEYW